MKEGRFGLGGEVSVASQHGVEALGEGPPPTGVVETAEAPDDQTQSDATAAPGQIAWLPGIPVMDVPASRATRRAHASRSRTAGVEHDLVARPADEVNDQHGGEEPPVHGSPLAGRVPSSAIAPLGGHPETGGRARISPLGVLIATKL